MPFCFLLLLAAWNVAVIAGAPAALLNDEGDLKDGSHTVSIVEYKSREGAWVPHNLEATRLALNCQPPDVFM